MCNGQDYFNDNNKSHCVFLGTKGKIDLKQHHHQQQPTSQHTKMSVRAFSEAGEDPQHDRTQVNDQGATSLPEGSSPFQEVMAELNPHPSPQPSRKASRRLSKHTRPHIHKYGTSDLQSKADRALVEEDDEESEEEDVEEHDEKRDDKASPEKMILHGKCHCYFVENGNVTGLADWQCHHPHRSSDLHPPFSPSSSSPQHHFSPNTSPRITRKLAPDPTPEESPKVKNTFQPHRNVLLRPPAHLEEFRNRSNSDTAVMARLSNFRKTSRPSASFTNASNQPGSTSPRLKASSSPSSPGSTEELPGTPPSSSLRKARSSDLADNVLESLHVSSFSPRPVSPSEGSESSPREFEGSHGCKLSAKAVSSDELHYLYDQFLHSGSE